MEENICTAIQYDYCYDSNNNEVCDDGDMQGDIYPDTGLDLDTLPAGETRALWLSHHLSADADNEYQGDTCTWPIAFTLKQLGIPQPE